MIWALKVQSSACRTKVNAEAQLQAAVAARCNTISYNVHQGGAHYNSAFYTRCSKIEAGFDPLAYLTKRGAELGIAVFAWICPGVDVYQFNPTWDLSGKYGAPLALHWTDFSLQEVRDRVAAIAGDIVSKYRVGISLDYIRYPDTYYPDWQPDMIHPGTQISHQDITNTVKGVRQKLTGTTRLMAHVRASSWTGVCQDWFNWLRQDLIDIAMPMVYVEKPGEVTTKYNLWPKDLPQARIYPTLWLYDNTSGKELPKQPVELKIEIDECKSLGFKSLVFFDNRMLAQNNEYSTILKEEAEMPIVNDLKASADSIDAQIVAINAALAQINEKMKELSASAASLTSQATLLRQLSDQLTQADTLADQLASLL